MTNQQANAAEVEHHEDEGHSIAGWVSVFVMVVGFAIGTIFFYLANTLMVWVGVGVIVVGAILWPILKFAGLGPKSH